MGNKTAAQARDQWLRRVIEHARWAEAAEDDAVRMHNLAQVVAYADAALREAVTDAREQGWTWQQIADSTAAAGISSRQAAHQRWN